MTNLPVVFVIDDDPLIRESIVRMANQKLAADVFGFGSAVEFLKNVQPGDVGCIVSDYRMEPMNGLSLQRELKRLDIHLPIIFISGQGNISVAVEAMENGAVTFMQKPFRSTELTSTIEKAIQLSRNLEMAAAKKNAARSLLARLNELEKATLLLCVEGKSNRQIAGRLDIGLRSVERYKRKIYDATGSESVVQLAQLLDEANATAEFLRQGILQNDAITKNAESQNVEASEN